MYADTKIPIIIYLCSKYDFAGAERIYLADQRSINQKKYEEIRDKYIEKFTIEKLLRRIKPASELGSRYDFVGAEEFYLANRQIIKKEKYEKIRKKYIEEFSIEQLSRLIKPVLAKCDWVLADKLYDENKNTILEIHYKEAKDEAFTREVLILLQKKEFDVADQLAFLNNSFFKNQYLVLKSEYLGKHINSFVEVTLSQEDAQSLSMAILKEKPGLANTLTLKKISLWGR